MFSITLLAHLILVCFLGKHAQCQEERMLNSFHIPEFEMIEAIMAELPESQCTHDLLQYFQEMEEVKHGWAVKMFDATVKFPFGLLNGNSYQFGHFDECIAIEGPTSNDDSNGTASFQGQYCLAKISVDASKINDQLSEADLFHARKLFRKNQFQMRWGFCVPSTCSVNNTEAFLGEFFKLVVPSRPVNVKLDDADCFYKAPTVFTAGKICFGVFIASFILFVLSATGYECFYMIKQDFDTGYTVNHIDMERTLLQEVIISFSLIKNVCRVMNIRERQNDMKLDCIFGIRAITMSIILFGHAISFLISSPCLTQNYILDSLQKVQNAVLINNPILVETFLLVSGFLMCRILLIELEKNPEWVNVFAVYGRRYIRLTPAYAFVIIFYCTYLIDLGEGPLWNSRIKLEQDRCLKSWWTNILYINNYVNNDQLCMFQSWYLSVDMQLFVLAPFVVFHLWSKPIVGMVLLAILCLGSGVVPFIVTLLEHLDPTLMIYPEEVNDYGSNYYFIHYYIKTHMRANSYLIGILFGYVVHKVECTSTKIPFLTRILVGILAIILGTSSLLSVLTFYQDDYNYDPVDAAFFASLHRISWSFAIGWTILVCITSTSYVNNILSWKGFQPISKLSYCAYLVNGIVVLHSYGQTRTAKYLTTYNLICEAIAQVVMTFIGAFVLCLFFECPLQNLDKLLLRARVHKTSSSSNGKTPMPIHSVS